MFCPRGSSLNRSKLLLLLTALALILALAGCDKDNGGEQQNTTPPEDHLDYAPPEPDNPGGYDVIDDFNYPYEPDTPAPAPHEGTFVSDYGTMTFNGDGESVTIDFNEDLAQRLGLPAGARIITDFSEITGTWKGQIYSDWLDVEHEQFDLMTVGIGGTPSDAALVADWYLNYRVYGGRTKDTTGDADTVYSGSFERGTLTVTAGRKTIVLDQFYELDGKQYGCGTIEGQAHTAVSLVRP